MMTARKEHVLHPVKGSTYPKWLVTVDCTVEEVVNGEWLNRSLVDWHALVTPLSKGVPGVEEEWFGRAAWEWWRRLIGLLRKGGLVWITSYRNKIVWSLLGLWKKLEYEEMCLWDQDPRDKVDLAEIDDRKPSGYLVISDPPNIVQARIPGFPGSIRWVDIRNYGINFEDKQQSARQRRNEMHLFMLRMIKVLRERGLGSLQTTQGSQAFYSFRRKHMRHGLLVHTREPALGLEKASNHGGRCECFRIGTVEGPIWHYDYRNLYASVCANRDLPIWLRDYRVERRSLSILALRNPQESIADVEIETQEPDYPVFRKGLIVWPVGYYRTTLAGPELVDAYERCRIRRVWGVAEYHMAPALQSFALEMHELRLRAEREHDSLMRQWLKAMMVSLPGKFAQRDRNWQNVNLPAPGPVWDEGHWYDKKVGWRRWRVVANQVQVQQVADWSNVAIPSIATWITSAGRMRLLEALRIVGREHCYYCDTDSVFVDTTGHLRLMESGLIKPGEMGYLKFEGKYDRMEIRGIKDYTVDNRRVTSGFPRGDQLDISDTDDYWHTPWLAVATQKKCRPGSSAVRRTYQRQGTYRHGRIGPGGVVYPWVMGG